MSYESNILALVLLNLLNSLQKRDKMLDKRQILSLSPTRLIKSIKHEHSCKILYISSVGVSFQGIISQLDKTLYDIKFHVIML